MQLSHKTIRFSNLFSNQVHVVARPPFYFAIKLNDKCRSEIKTQGTQMTYSYTSRFQWKLNFSIGIDLGILDMFDLSLRRVPILYIRESKQYSIKLCSRITFTLTKRKTTQTCMPLLSCFSCAIGRSYQRLDYYFLLSITPNYSTTTTYISNSISNYSMENYTDIQDMNH